MSGATSVVIKVSLHQNRDAAGLLPQPAASYRRNSALPFLTPTTLLSITALSLLQDAQHVLPNASYPRRGALQGPSSLPRHVCALARTQHSRNGSSNHGESVPSMDTVFVGNFILSIVVHAVCKYMVAARCATKRKLPASGGPPRPFVPFSPCVCPCAHPTRQKRQP